VRQNAPFRPDDLAELNKRFLARASAVIAMQEIAAGNRDHKAIGLRHDCDAGHSLATAVKMARWEADRGYRSTYYILHTSPYWEAAGFRRMLEQIAGYGHEIGIHTDALAEALKTGRDPDSILHDAIATLRGYGFPVRGVAGHGNPICNRDRAPGEITFANDEQFVECARPQEGEPDRIITRGGVSLKLAPRPLADFGLDYEALTVGRPYPFRCSDSGGKWLRPGFEETVELFDYMLASTPELEAAAQPHWYRQLHLLIHPDWWAHAFSLAVAA
jgi:hypothetical protein